MCTRKDKIIGQIYINKKQAGFVFKMELEFPLGIGPISFQDMNQDGTIDLIFPSCYQNKCFIHILYNNQIPLCTDALEKCRNPNALCTADDDFVLDMGNLRMHSIFDISQMGLKGQIISMTDESFQGILPIPIRIGDFNNDGYPDIMLTTFMDYKSMKHVSLFESIECDSKCLDYPDSTKRSFKLIENIFIKNSISAAFMDYDNDGQADVFMTFKKPDGSINTKVYRNEFQNDAFFYSTLGMFRLIVLNNLCLDCDTGPNYGVNFAGASIKHLVIDYEGKKRVTASSQMPQQAFQSLNSPRNLKGIGRSNNYIDTLFVGTTKHDDIHFTSYRNIIPNSQIVISPFDVPEEYF
jgi:integrin alpha FG-GAP repeat containing protein 1